MAEHVEEGQATKKKGSPIQLVHMRLRTSDVAFTKRLEAQREIPFSDLARRIYQQGVLLEAATGSPDEEGTYGTYSGERLAELLLPTVDALIAFIMRHGQTPHTIQMLQDLLARGVSPLPTAASGSATRDEWSAGHATQEEQLITEVAPDAQSVITLFQGMGAGPTQEESAKDL